MSWLSEDWNKFTAWLGSIEGPASKTAAQAASTALAESLVAVEKAGELIITDAANAALAFLPAGLGTALTPAVDNLIVSIANKILSKHSSGAATVTVGGAPS